MLKEVQDVIKRIEAFLVADEDFETVVDDQYTEIKVFARDGDMMVYHGYELHLLEQSFISLDATLDFKIVKDEGQKRFVVTTDATYNLMSYINKTNVALRQYQDDAIAAITVTEKITEEGRGEFTIFTAFLNGTWTRCDVTKAELLFAAVNNLPIAPSDNGVFWYPDLIALNNAFFDELEAATPVTE